VSGGFPRTGMKGANTYEAPGCQGAENSVDKEGQKRVKEEGQVLDLVSPKIQGTTPTIPCLPPQLSPG